MKYELISCGDVKASIEIKNNRNYCTITFICKEKENFSYSFTAQEITDIHLLMRNKEN